MLLGRDSFLKKIVGIVGRGRAENLGEETSFQPLPSRTKSRTRTRGQPSRGIGPPLCKEGKKKMSRRYVKAIAITLPKGKRPRFRRKEGRDISAQGGCRQST